MTGDPNAQAKAADAIFNRIASAAELAAPEDLLKLADAYGKVVHGPQGGHMVNETDYDYRSKTDQHETKHEGEDRKRPAGFSTADER